MINTMAEAIAPAVEHLTLGKVSLRILFIYADRYLANATCVILPEILAFHSYTGHVVRDGVMYAYDSATTIQQDSIKHNKYIMKGIYTVIIATVNDCRAVESGAHAYATRDGQYRSMTTWSQDEQGNLVGELELPMSLGIVGGASRVHPMAKVAYDILQVESA